MFWQLLLAQAILVLSLAVFLPVLLGYLLNTTADQFISERLKREAQAIATGRPTWWQQARGPSFQGSLRITDTGALPLITDISPVSSGCENSAPIISRSLIALPRNSCGSVST